MSYDYTASVQAFHEARRQAAAAAKEATAFHEAQRQAATAAAAKDAIDDDSVKRRRLFLQTAVETMEALSQKCPLTPLLWIQYASTLGDYYLQCYQNNMSAAHHVATLQLEYQTLQLGLTEFPGSALMHVRSLVVQLSILVLQWEEHKDEDKTDVDNRIDDVISSIQSSVEDVGRGSHRNEDYLVVVLYRVWMVLNRIQCRHLDDISSRETEVKHIILQRSRTPMRTRNDDLASDIQRFLDPALVERLSVDLSRKVDEGRRYEAKVFHAFIQYEDAIDVALLENGLLSRMLPEFERNYCRAKVAFDSFIVKNTAFWDDLITCWEHLDWDAILLPRDQLYGMGLGTPELAQSFVRYAKAIKNYKVPHYTDSDDDMGGDDVHNPVLTEYQLSSLSMSVYERAVAECPCIESLWMTYIRDLQSWIQGHSHHRDERTHRSAIERLETVTVRAFRNCPYSISLLHQRLESMLLLSKYSRNVLNDNVVLDIVQDGFDLGFLPKSPLVLWNTYALAIRIMKRRLMIVLAESATSNNQVQRKKNVLLFYDDPEPILKKRTESTKQSAVDEMDDAILDEVEGLLDDIGDMYKEVENRLQTPAMKENGWSKELCSMLWNERAQTEMLLLHPLRTLLEEEEDVMVKAPSPSNPTLQFFEKCTSVHNPPHPDSYVMYIQYFAFLGSTCVKSPKDVLVHLRQIRGLYAKSVAAVGKGKEAMTLGSSAVSPVQGLPPARDYDTALVRLCNDWINFEQIVGSPRSLGKATVIIEKKLQKAGLFSRSLLPQPATVDVTASAMAISADVTAEPSTNEEKSKKRAHSSMGGSNDDVVELSVKKGKTEVSTLEVQNPSMDAQETTLETQNVDDHSAIHSVDLPENPSTLPEKPRPKVRVGPLEYPAHPFTIRVSQLSAETEDMDLVDAFRPTCGPIVHAKIVRDHHSVSKGWGLIQFEQSASVEKALALDETLGIRERLVNVERSHMAAVALVPPGRHRIRPPGEGKVSKRNQKQRARRAEGSSLPLAPPPKETRNQDSVPVHSEPPTISPTRPSSVTAFRPRTVHRGSHPKPRLPMK